MNFVKDHAFTERVSSDYLISDFVAEAIKIKLSADEELVGRMLSHWVSDVDLPVVIIDPDWNIVGLGPGDRVGDMVRVFVRAEDFRT